VGTIEISILRAIGFKYDDDDDDDDDNDDDDDVGNAGKYRFCLLMDAANAAS